MGLVLVIPLLKYLVVGAGKNHQVRQWVMEFEMGMGFWRDMPTVMVLGSEGAIVLGQRMSLGTMRHSSRQAWSSILMLGPRVLGACHRLDAGDEEPNVVDNSLNKSSKTSSGGTGSRKISGAYPPAFSASPSESYLEWKRSVKCWIAGEGGQLPGEVMGPRCLAMLKGRASVIVRHLKIEEVSQSGGLDLVFQALESSPMVMELDGQRGEKARREFLRCRRQAGESMESFLMRAQAQRAVMEEEDPTFAVGDRFLVGYILDHAELTLKDRVMVLAAAQNQMSSLSVFPALRRMGPLFSASQAKLRAIKQARGPDRRERLKKLMQENPCRNCGQYGHWSKDPECPRNAKAPMPHRPHW